MRTWLPLLALALAACASVAEPVRLVPPPDRTPEQEAADRAACEAEARDEVFRTARRPRGLFLVFGDDAVMRTRAYRACLERRGYVVQ